MAKPPASYIPQDSRLATFIRQVRSALSSQLTLEENVRSEWRELTWTGGDTDVEVATVSTPRGVFLASVRPEDGSAVGAVVSLDWEPAPGGIRIRAINGLTSGTRYAVRLLVVER